MQPPHRHVISCIIIKRTRACNSIHQAASAAAVELQLDTQHRVITQVIIIIITTTTGHHRRQPRQRRPMIGKRFRSFVILTGDRMGS